jgi:hypothetical protein
MSSPRISASSSLSLCVPRNAATTDPALEPEITRWSRFCSRSALTTPKWNMTMFAPPLSISAERPKLCPVWRKNISFWA